MRDLAEHLVKEHRWGLQLEDEVRLEVVGTVTRFVGDHVEVQLAGATPPGATLIRRPGQLKKVQSKKLCPRPLLRAFCGYMDIWFLRATFVTDWSTRKDGIEERIKSEADMVFRELEMEQWEQDQVPPAIKWTLGLYLSHVLSPSVYLYKRHAGSVLAALGSAFCLLVLYVSWGFANVRFNDSAEEATARGVHAFKAVEHAPVTPLVLLLCSHLIMVLFAVKQLEELSKEGSKHLPFPLTYTIIVGKAFMVFRMVMAYSSANLGVSVDYFVWQELLLTSTHGVLSLFVGDPSPHTDSGHSYARQLTKSFALILGIDGFKTLVMLVFWCNYTEGPICFYINRLPTLRVQLCASVLVHAVLDLAQTAMTMFTMFIGRAFAEHVSGRKHECKLKSAPKMVKEPCPVSSVEALVGRWKDSSGAYVSFEARPWDIQVPDSVTDSAFRFPTVYEYKATPGVSMPTHYMEVLVPKGSKPGDKLSVTEVRSKHSKYGLQSYDAKVLIKEDNQICLWPGAFLRLEKGKQPYVMYGKFANEKWTKESPDLCTEERE